LLSTTSEVQSVVVFQSAQYGKVLVLDGVIQMTEKDEFAYYEMLVHLPLCTVTDASKESPPFSVLLLGGGNGGALKQVVTQYDTSTVKEIIVVERDPMVIQAAREHFGAAPYFDNDDGRVTVVRADDAASYLASVMPGNTHHVVIVEETPPNEELFLEFCANLYAALAPGGVACIRTQGFWMIHNMEMVSVWMACCRDIFDAVEYATTTLPTCGQVGFVLARRTTGDHAERGSCRIPVRLPAHLDRLKWYSRDMHQAAFVLPPFVTKQLIGYENDENMTQSYPSVNANVQARDTSIDVHGGDDDNNAVTNKCFLLDAIVLPQYVTSALASFHNTSSLDLNEEGEQAEDSDVDEEKCFLFEPPRCTIQ
jgi:spermidine synthase